MTETLHIQIDRAEGSLQRLIGLVERRGFHIERMSVSEAGAHREVRIGVHAHDASRCTNVLARQIDRLIGVRRMAPAPDVASVERAAPCTA
jgi:acetolactate synthase-1/3 small subunit